MAGESLHGALRETIGFEALEVKPGLQSPERPQDVGVARAVGCLPTRAAPSPLSSLLSCYYKGTP